MTTIFNEISDSPHVNNSNNALILDILGMLLMAYDQSCKSEQKYVPWNGFEPVQVQKPFRKPEEITD